jgi:hypothetical protein
MSISKVQGTALANVGEVSTTAIASVNKVNSVQKSVDDPTITFTNTYASAQQPISASVTFSSCALGAAASDRVVVACIGYESSYVQQDGTISSVTIDGNSMTNIISGYETTYSFGAGASIWWYNLTTGTTADVTVNFTRLTQGVSCLLYTTSDTAGTLTAYDTDSDNTGYEGSVSIDVEEGGAIIGCATYHIKVVCNWQGGYDLTPSNSASSDYHDTSTCLNNAQSAATGLTGLCQYSVSAVVASFSPPS